MISTKIRIFSRQHQKCLDGIRKSCLHIQNGFKARKVVIGMSGGVDSTVSAHLLKNQGLEVVGVFMKNWDIADETGSCRADKEAEDAEHVCKKLDIPFRVVNFVKEYWNEVFTTLVTEYQQGWTPNPDIDCNRNIKFGHFHKFCHEQIGCDGVATGHYARTSFGDCLEHYDPGKRVKLIRAMDCVKDQTFFLSQVSQESLKTAIFPVGNLTKDVVKKIASATGFDKIAKKKESMGICFVGKRKQGFAGFLGEYVQPSPGPLVDIETYKNVGQHNGIHLCTIGQRCLLKSRKQKSFVVEKDLTTNTVYVCFGEDHPALYSENFFTDNPYWIDQAPDELRDRSKDQTLVCSYRSQNTEPLMSVNISHGMSSTSSNWESIDRNSLIVSLTRPQRAITPGQYSVFYLGDECLGSSRITKVGPSLFAMNKNNCRDNLNKKLP